MRALSNIEVNDVAGRKVIEPAVDENFSELALSGLFPSSLDGRAVNNVLYGHLDVLLDQIVHIASLGQRMLQPDDGLEISHQGSRTGVFIGRERLIECSNTATTAGVTNDHDVGDTNVHDGVVEKSLRRVVFGLELVGNVPLNKHFSGFTSHDSNLWNSGVGASNPEEVGSLALYLLGHELGLLRSDLSGPVPISFEDFSNLLEFLGSHRVLQVHINLLGGLEGFSVERHFGDAGSAYRSKGRNEGRLTEIECGS